MLRDVRDQHREQGHPSLAHRLAANARPRLVDERRRVDVDRRLEQGFLPREVRVRRRRRDARVAGDVGDRGAPEAVLGEAPHGDLEQSLASSIALAAGRRHRARRGGHHGASVGPGHHPQ